MTMGNIAGPSKELLEKYEQLEDYLKSLESVVVAFSSGVDSTFLLFAAKKSLGDKVIWVPISFKNDDRL